MWQMRTLIQVLFGMVLGYFGVEDVKYLGIQSWELSLCILLIPMARADGMCKGMLLGSAFLLISFFSREQLGYGDSCLLVILGGVLGWKAFITCLIWSFLFLEIAGGIVLLRHRFRRKVTLPMIPYLFFGYMIALAETGGYFARLYN